MQKQLLIIAIILLSKLAVGNTPSLSFESHLKPSYHGLTQHQVDSLISHSDFENFRLKNSRTTLSFDGFDIVLFSASEASQAGVISNTARYPVSFPASYHLPVFHMVPNGHFTAEYIQNTHTKSSGR